MLVAIIRQGVVAVLWGEGAEVARLREEQVENYLGVERPVTRVIEDEHGIYFYSVIAIALAVFSGRQSTVGYWTSVELVVLWRGEWPQSWECGYEVGRCENICKTIAVGVTWSTVYLYAEQIADPTSQLPFCTCLHRHLLQGHICPYNHLRAR